ncbi:MAG TPA: hypothetical protein VFZ65_12275 [Planctomycetota bacterium]|nr:hypothetical protein [Planctomycetota bacterium]
MSRVRAGFVRAFVFACGGALLAQSVEVAFVLPEQGLSFGADFEVEVARAWPANGEPEPFDERALAPLSLQFVEKRDWPAPPGMAGDRWRYRARAYVAGELQFAPVRFRYRRGDRTETVRCTPRALLVQSVLPEPPGDVEWPGDVRELPQRGTRLWWLAAACALVGLGLWSRWRRPRSAAPPPAAPAPAVHTIALAELDALAAPGENAAEIEAFYVQLAEIVRSHSERRFAVRAAVRTSQELVRSVPVGGAELGACLQACDLVKFAARRPTAEGHATARHDAVAYVRASAGALP